MEQLDPQDLWRRIPPEEKFELMAKAHSKGVFAVTISILVCCTIAVGLRLSWMMWSSLIFAPFIFQYAAGKAWRRLRPTVMLEYLAARSAARRYAYTLNGQELGVQFLFKGHLKKLYHEDQIQERLEGMLEHADEALVWVALFRDSVVMMSEGRVGAELELGSILDDRLRIESKTSKNIEYTNDRELIFIVRDKNKITESSYSLTSHYPAALIVFEKRILEAKRALMAQKEKVPASIAPIASGLLDSDDKDDLDLDFGSSGLIGM